MANPILDIFNPKEMLAYVGGREYPAMLGEELFPAVKLPDYDVSYIVGNGRKPVAASVSAFDSEAQIATREAVTRFEMTLAIIKRKIKLKEQELIRLANPRSDAELTYMKDLIYNDVDLMVSAVRARIEAMRMEILATGELNIDENGVDLSLDYGVPDAHRAMSVDWTGADADPIADITGWVRTLRADCGGTFARAITTGEVMSAILTSSAVRTAVYGADDGRLVTRAMLSELLSSLGLPVIEVYDEGYRTENAGGMGYTYHSYLPSGAFIILPSGAELGRTVYAPTPEEIQLSGKDGVDSSDFGNVTAIVYEESADPVATYTKASAVALPSFPLADMVFQAKVIQPKAAEGSGE